MFQLFPIILVASVFIEVAEPSDFQLQNESRIVGGLPANEGQFPFMASLQDIRDPDEILHICGLSIISAHFLASAAHCLYLEELENLIVYVGSVFLYGNGTYYNIKRIIIHPRFDYHIPFAISHGKRSYNGEKLSAYNSEEPTLPNDIAMVKVATPIVFSNYVQPINLPTNITVNAGDEVIVIGWGLRGYVSAGYSNDENQLRYLKTTIVDMKACSSYTKVLDGQICHSGIYGQGTCMGDSGGPLIYEKNNKSYIIGIVSFGIGNDCGEEQPDVCTRVSYYLQWIQEQLTK